MLKIEKSRIEDLDRLAEVFACARQIMKDSGNPDQWGDDGPGMQLVIDDIAKGNSYVVKDDEKIVATFAFIVGEDPTYKVIIGSWLNDDPYGTIHRIASDGSVKGIFDFVIDQVKSYGIDIRIDTHRDNAIMRHAVAKNGFRECGIIFIADGSERIAYQRLKDE